MIAIFILLQMIRRIDMFSGIVEMIGTILQITTVEGCKQLTIAPAEPLHALSIGDSIAVNGVCLTVTECDETNFKVTSVPETLRITNLDHLLVQQHVNLEQALQFGDRMGGHFVQGHIDGTGEILEVIGDNSNAWLIKISLPKNLASYLVPKGCITLDGMSMTVIDVFSDYFTITLIPHTKRVTIARDYRVGSVVNIEVDMMGKYLENLINKQAVGASSC